LELGAVLAARGKIVEVLGVGPIDADADDMTTEALLLVTVPGVTAEETPTTDTTLATGDMEIETGMARGVVVTPPALADTIERGVVGVVELEADIIPAEVPKKLLISATDNPSFCIISRILLSPISMFLILIYLEYLSDLGLPAADNEDIFIMIIMRT